MTNQSRRSILQIAVATLLASLLPVRVFAQGWPEKAFTAKQLKDALLSVTGSEEIPAESAQIQLKVPAIAENGAVVPVSVSADLKSVDSISILVSNNPSPLISTFTFDASVQPYVSTRVKMAKTSSVIAIVKTDKGYVSASKEVKVTIGGCGG